MAGANIVITTVCFFIVLLQCTPVRFVNISSPNRPNRRAALSLRSDLFDSSKPGLQCVPKSREQYVLWAHSVFGVIIDFSLSKNSSFAACQFPILSSAFPDLFPLVHSSKEQVLVRIAHVPADLTLDIANTEPSAVALPIWIIVTSLTLSRRKAIQVVLVFCVGFASIITGIVRLVLVFTTDMTTDT